MGHELNTLATAWLDAIAAGGGGEAEHARLAAAIEQEIDRFAGELVQELFGSSVFDVT